MNAHPVESLSAFLDDELGDAERRGVEAHLAACPSCARHLRELAAVDALARGLPPAGAPDGYLEALPGRVRRKIRADRPASTRSPWVWPLAAGLALAVLAPLVLRQQLARERVSPGRPAVGMEAPSPPPPTVAPKQLPLAAARPTVAEDEGRVARPQAVSRAPRRESAPEPKARDAFVAAPPPAALANESDRAARTARDEIAQAPRAAGRLEEERMESAGARAERVDAPSSLKKADASPQSAMGVLRRSEATSEDKAFRDNSSLPASTPDEARTAREAWRRFVSVHSAGPRADEGRVRFIEAAVAVFRLTRDEEDRLIAEREGRAYLALPGASQAARVKAALARLDETR